MNFHLSIPEAAQHVKTLTQQAERHAGKRVAVVICGANISRETLRTVI